MYKYDFSLIHMFNSNINPHRHALSTVYYTIVRRIHFVPNLVTCPFLPLTVHFRKEVCIPHTYVNSFYVFPRKHVSVCFKKLLLLSYLLERDSRHPPRCLSFIFFPLTTDIRNCSDVNLYIICTRL